MVSICFDVGNTKTKLAVFKNNEIIIFRVIETDNLSFVTQVLNENLVEAAIISSVAEISNDLLKILGQKLSKVFILNTEMQLPIENYYETKETLGKDRIAAVVGANYLFPGTNLLIIDAGTAITYDFINKDGQYSGGNISPGIQMRFKALHQFTNRLPLVEPVVEFQPVGINTTSAIRAGVQSGMIFEIDGMIDYFKELYPGLKVLFTGGDTKFFDNKLKNMIFVLPNLVMVGLNRILEYNAQKL